MWRTSCPIAPSPRGVRCPIFLLDQFFRRFDLFQQQKIEAQSIFLISEIQTIDFLSDLIYFNRKKEAWSIFQPKKSSLDFYQIYFQQKKSSLDQFFNQKN